MASNRHSVLRAEPQDGDTAERRTVTAIGVPVGSRGAAGGRLVVCGRGLERGHGHRGGSRNTCPSTSTLAYGRGRGGMPSRRRPLPSSVYWRRRILVLLVVVGAFLAGGKALEALGGGPLAAAEVRSSPSSAVAGHSAPPANRTSPTVHLVTTPVHRATYVVQPGDTLWSIARSLQPEGDVRPLVDDLAASRQGRPLQPGERIELP